MSRRNEEAAMEVEAVEAVETAITELPEGVETNTEVFNLLDGTLCTKSAFIREQFTALNKSRKAIAEEFAIPYRAVYGATINMENEAEPATRGRAVCTKIAVTVEGKNYVKALEDGTFEIAGEIVASAGETVVVDRNEWIQAQVEAGANRGDLAKVLDVSYGVIYAATKDAAGSRQKYEVTLEDGTSISRSEYIRQLVAEGMSKGDIAKKLEVEYSVVWQATKKLKTDEERFAEDVKKLEKYMDLVENPEDLRELITMAENIVVKASSADVVTEEEVEPEVEAVV